MTWGAQPNLCDVPERLSEQRRSLPDQPGVYLLKDADGEVVYVGKARSIRKRVASHFAGRSATEEDEG